MSDPELIEAEKRRIQRASDTLQAIFFMFREATWHTHIWDVKCLGDDIIIKEDPHKTLRWQGWWSPYPTLLTPDAYDKAAVLTTMACYDVAHLKKLTEQVLEGMKCE